MIYDVLIEPWIPVRYLDGSFKRIGLKQFFNEAHLIHRLDGLNAIQEFSLYKFLILFSMCIYRPMISDDIFNIAKIEQFDMQQFDKYIKFCIEQGCSFDLFDENRPFLQAIPDDTIDSVPANIKSVGYLDLQKATGNNPIFFDYYTEDKIAMKPSEALIGILVSYNFSLAMSQGYPSGLNGAPPLYFIPTLDNLFETIVCSMQPIGHDNSEPELWLNPRKIIPKEKVAKASVLWGMLFPSRRIRLFLDDDNLVRNCVFAPGLDFTGYDGWHDYYVVYGKKNNKRFSVKPNPDIEPWRYISSVYNTDSDDTKHGSYPNVVRQVATFLKGNDIYAMPVNIYALCTTNATCHTMWSSNILLDVRIIKDSELTSLIVDASNIVKKHHNSLSSIYSSICRAIKGIKGKDSFISQRKIQFYRFFNYCEQYFYEFSNKISNLYLLDDSQIEDKKIEYITTFEKRIIRAKFNCINSFILQTCNTGQNFLDAQRAINNKLFSKSNVKNNDINVVVRNEGGDDILRSQYLENNDTNVNSFLSKVAILASHDNGFSATMRRSAGKRLRNADGSALIAFNKLFDASNKNADLYFLVACIQCFWKIDEKPKAIKLCRAINKLNESERNNFEKRIAELMNLKIDDDEYFFKKLVSIIRFCASKGIVINCNYLLSDLLNWNTSNGSIRMVWAKDLVG